jgi:ribose/xylose/arabinose/galactoside ABC-type transport system permease subunit
VTVDTAPTGDSAPTDDTAPTGDSAPTGEAASTARPARRISPSLRDNLQVYLPLLVIIIGLALYTNAHNGNFLSAGNIKQILVANAVLGILAVGQTILLVGGQFDLSVGSMVSFGAVLVAKQITGGVGEFVAVVVVILVAAATGLVWGLLVAHIRIAPFILTLGGLAVFASAAVTLSSSTTIPIPDNLLWLQTGTVIGIPTPVVLWAAALIVGGILLHFTRFGHTVYAVGANEEAAFLSGTSVVWVKIAVFVFNGVLVGVAAIVMAGRAGAGDPNVGAGLELTTIAAIVLGGASLAGGRGTVLGSLLGVLVLGVVTSSLTFLNVPNSYNQFVFGAILIVAVTVTAIAELRRRRAGTKHR